MIIDLHSGFPPGKSFCPVKLRVVYRVVWWLILIVAGLLLVRYWSVIEEVALGAQAQILAEAHGAEVEEANQRGAVPEGQRTLPPLRGTADPEYAAADRQRDNRASGALEGWGHQPDGQSGADLQWRLRAVSIPLPSPVELADDGEMLRGDTNDGEPCK